MNPNANSEWTITGIWDCDGLRAISAIKGHHDVTLNSSGPVDPPGNTGIWAITVTAPDARTALIQGLADAMSCEYDRITDTLYAVPGTPDPDQLHASWHSGKAEQET